MDDSDTLKEETFFTQITKWEYHKQTEYFPRISE